MLSAILPTDVGPLPLREPKLPRSIGIVLSRINFTRRWNLRFRRLAALGSRGRGPQAQRVGGPGLEKAQIPTPAS